MPHQIHLDEKNKEILACLREGMKTREIADRVYLSADRVKHRISDMIEKTGTNNRASLVAYCYENQLFSVNS